MAEFEIDVSFQGKVVIVPGITSSTTAQELYTLALGALLTTTTDEDDQLYVKLLYKGKKLAPTSNATVFTERPKKRPKLLALKSSATEIQKLNSKRSDPLIRGFDQEKTAKPSPNTNSHWGDLAYTSKEYKFCRIQACTWQSFGHRPSESTPHDFAATALLEQLASDPGVGSVLQERELVVGTLGEMDPIDDRLMQQKEQQGGCLLGYNTNAGARIDIKLRTDDLTAFRPYPELVSTLIHELSHNWVGEHNLLFWTNYGQMYCEYLYCHKRLRSHLVRGKTTADLAGLVPVQLDQVYEYVMNSLVREMAQHGLHPNMIAGAIRERCRELEDTNNKKGGRIVGASSTVVRVVGSARERALAAAERRRLDDSEKQSEEKKKDGS